MTVIVVVEVGVDAVAVEMVIPAQEHALLYLDVPEQALA